MDFRQKVKDFGLALKYSRKFQVIFGTGLILTIWMLMSGSGNPRRAVAPTDVAYQNKKISSPGEDFKDLAQAIGGSVKELNEKVSGISDTVEKLGARIDESDKTNALIFKKLFDNLTALENASAGQGSGIDPVAIGPEAVPTQEVNTMDSWGELDAVKLNPPPPPVKNKIAIIGAGDSVRVQLLAGVNAPTDGTPYPVVFKLTDAIDGPDGSALPVGEARLVAAAQGSLSDQRALFRITKLNMRFPNGSRQVIDVDGWIVGEDGIRGMEGVLVDPFGKVMMGALQAGVLQGFGQGLSRSQMTTGTTQQGPFEYLSGNASEYAVGQGIGAAGTQWADFIKERSKLLVPHVKVLSGRSATAVFAETVTVDGLYDALEDTDVGVQTASLD